MKDKEPYFSSSYDALGAYRRKRINLDSPLWLRWRLDQRVIGSREVPIEVQYESLGTYHEIYGNYLINSKKHKKRNPMYIHSNHCRPYFFLSRNIIIHTRVLSGLFIHQLN
jgi:DNA-directed RNA polymerase subunit beta'